MLFSDAKAVVGWNVSVAPALNILLKLHNPIRMSRAVIVEGAKEPLLYIW